MAVHVRCNRPRSIYQYFILAPRLSGEALEPRVAHSCRSLSWFLKHEAARSISTPPGRYASPSQVTPPQFVRCPEQFTRTHFYSWVERGTVRVECLTQEHNSVPGQGPVSRKPRKVFGPVKPFLNHLYIKTEKCIRLTLLV